MITKIKEFLLMFVQLAACLLVLFVGLFIIRYYFLLIVFVELFTARVGIFFAISCMMIIARSYLQYDTLKHDVLQKINDIMLKLFLHVLLYAAIVPSLLFMVVLGDVFLRAYVGITIEGWVFNEFFLRLETTFYLIIGCESVWLLLVIFKIVKKKFQGQV